jgi:hypothetical protein
MPQRREIVNAMPKGRKIDNTMTKRRKIDKRINNNPQSTTQKTKDRATLH